MEQINLFGEKNNNSKERIDYLVKELQRHSKLYYEKDNPEISDYEYDMLMNELKRLEKDNPELIKEDSPTQVVGGKIDSKFSPVKHDVQMLSLQDVFSYDEIKEFTDKIYNEYGNIQYIVETKIDGLSVSLEYVGGKFIRGSTRGDGLVGEDVTENLMTLNSIPKELTEKIDIEVRGEVYISKSDFEILNEDRMKKDEPLLANPRNAAAGSLRQLDINMVKERKLNIFVFNIQKCDDKQFNSHLEGLNYLKKLGFTTVPYCILCNSYDDIINEIENIGNNRDKIEFDIDGAVIKIDDIKIREELGTTSKVPKWALAYKYPPEEKETLLVDIELNVGRTGAVTPTAILKPVKIAGSTVSKTTLHNFDYIKDKDIRIGDTVRIKKSGDVIPEVISVVTEKRPNDSKKYIEPTICPVCNEELEKSVNEVALRCTNSECPAMIYRSIEHFVSRDAMDIEGMGSSIVEQLISEKLIEDVADIYYIKFEDLLKLDRFAEKSASNLIASIDKSKKNSLDRLIFGLGIRHIGKKAAKTLSENVENITDLYNIKPEELLKLNDYGNIMANSIYNFFSKDKTKEIISKLEKANVNLLGIKKVNISDKFKGLTFVITGTMEKLSREEMTKVIESHSGIVSNSVSKKTDYLVAGENSGSKLKKAQDINIKIISEEELFNMIKGENK